MDGLEGVWEPLEAQIMEFMSANGFKLAGLFIVFVAFCVIWNMFLAWAFPKDDLGFRAGRWRH